MSLEPTHEPRSKKAKLDDSGIDKASLRQIQELECALDNNQSRLILDCAQKIITTTGLDQKLSMRLLKHVFEVRNKVSSTISNDLVCSKMTPFAVGEYLANKTIFRRSHSIDGFLDVVRLLLHQQIIDLKTKEGNELLHRIVAAGDTTLATLLIKAADVDINASRDPVTSRTLLHAVLRSCNIESNEKREEFVRLLLDQGAEVDARCVKGHSVLCTAIFQSDCSYQLVEELVLQRGAVVETLEGGNMLWKAVEEGQHEIAGILVRSGSRLDLREGSDSHTILQEVLRSNKIENTADKEELVRLMLDRGVNVNARDINGYSVLDDAIWFRNCSFKLVEELLAHGARLQKLKSGEHLWAAIEKRQVGMVAKLVRSGVDLSIRKGDNSRTTPLLAVLRSTMITDKTEQIVRLMLDRGTDVNACDDMGSVLDKVITHYYCSTQLVEKILRLGAFPSIENICLAAQCRPRLLPKLVEQQVPDKKTKNMRVVLALELLIEKDYNPDRVADEMWAVKEILRLRVPVSTLECQRQERPCSLVNLALRFGKKDIVKLLLQYGADPHQKNEFGYTPLFQATEFQDSEISRLLIEKGASVHALNDDGWSPIYGACMHESIKNVHLLLDLGADMNIVDSNNYSPLDAMDFVKLSDAGRLVIKYFALTVAKGGIFNDKDIANINKCIRSQSHYQKCMKEIGIMKVTNVYADVSYFSLLTKNTLRIPSVVISNIKQNINNASHLFPLYRNMFSHSYKIARMKYKLLQVERVHIQEALERYLPILVIEKIAHYSAVERGKQYQRNYYLTLHATL